jgi:mannose-6-phosphate isomerase-like protein (cupin superfamily)
VNVFDLDRLIEGLDTSRHDSAEFFRADTLSLTVAFWPAGSIDNQQPHTEDEVYFVASGCGKLRIGEEDTDVAADTIAFVGAGVEHRFHAIEEDLRILVFWSPPRGTNAPQ